MTLAKAGNLIIERTPATTVRRQLKGPTIYNSSVSKSRNASRDASYMRNARSSRFTSKIIEANAERTFINLMDAQVGREAASGGIIALHGHKVQKEYH
jgi:hypothetical protein